MSGIVPSYVENGAKARDLSSSDPTIYEAPALQMVSSTDTLTSTPAAASSPAPGALFSLPVILGVVGILLTVAFALGRK